MAPAIPPTVSSLPSQRLVTAAALSSPVQISPLRIFTANRDDGEKSKRFGYKAPTLAACLEIYTQGIMPDSAVGILLNLTPREVEQLKSRIRQLLETPILPPDAHNDLVSFEREISYKNGDTSTQEYKRPAKLSNLYRSCYVTSVGLSFPHLFKEPASHHEISKDWTANYYGCHSVVPWSFRRDILDRLIDTCFGETDNERRASTSGPPLHGKRPAPSRGKDDTPSKRARTETGLSTDLEHELLGHEDG
jgi:hypothetical protein